MNNFSVQLPFPLVLILVSSMGPYLVGNIRLEHLFIYGLTPLAFLLFPLARKLTFPTGPFLLFLLFCLSFAWASISHLSQFGAVDYSVGSIENFLQPICLSFILLYFISKASVHDLICWLKFTCVLIICLMAANACIAMANVFGLGLEVERYFVRGIGANDVSNWANSVSMGRYNGIFSQSFEAGLGYSVAVLCLGYLLSSDVRSIFLTLLTIMIFVGGVLSISKVFLFVGLPLSTLYLFFVFPYKRPRFLVLFAVLTVLAVSLLRQNLFFWSGLDHALRFFSWNHSSQGGALEIFTAGRFSSDDAGALHGIFFVLRESPLAGFGFVAPPFSLDSSYTEALWHGGMFSLLILLISFLVILFYAFFRYFRRSRESLFLIFLLVLVVFGALGGPTWLCNRVSVMLIYCFFLGLALLNRVNRAVEHRA